MLRVKSSFLISISSVLFLIFFFPTLGFSRTFKNAYISFEMLDNWKCNLEQTEWVCRAEDPQEAKEAVIILTAKEKGPTDTFPLYESHMSNPIVSQNKAGGTMTSNIVYKSTQLKVNDQPWLDALHGNSEVQNYLTRYVATIKDQIAILVTFSAHNKYFSKHSANFANTIKSLRVIASKDLLSRPDLGPIRGSNEQFGWGKGEGMQADLLASDDTGSQQQKGLLANKSVLGFLILLLALVGYIVLRIYQKKK